MAPEVIATVKESFAKHLAFIEDKLKSHGKNFLTGEKITIADFAVFALLSTCVFNKNLKSPVLGEALVGVVGNNLR